MKKKSARKVPRPRADPVTLAVHRHNHSVYYKRLEPAAFVLLTELRKGATLADACASAAATGEKAFEEKLKDWFTQWATFGWFVRPE